MDNKASTDVIQLQVQNSLRLQGKKMVEEYISQWK